MVRGRFCDNRWARMYFFLFVSSKHALLIVNALKSRSRSLQMAVLSLKTSKTVESKCYRGEEHHMHFPALESVLFASNAR